MRIRAGTAIATLTTAVALMTPAAAQETKWSLGESEYTIGIDCTSIIFPPARLEQQTFAFAAQQVPVDDLPYAGDVFYARITFGSIGDICGGGGNALPEFVPPAGVEVVEHGDPYWTVSENGVETRGNDPVVLGDGLFGGVVASVRDQRDGQVKSWPYANSGGFIGVHVPMRSRRRLTGIGTPEPTCPAREDGTGPCPADQAGDWLQVSTQVADGASPGTLVPALGLFAREPRAPRIVSARRSAGRVKVKIRTAPRFRIQATLKRGSRALARRRARANRSGVATLALGGAAGKLTIEARAIADDGSVSTRSGRTLR
jgi:hypothetical protein